MIVYSSLSRPSTGTRAHNHTTRTRITYAHARPRTHYAAHYFIHIIVSEMLSYIQLRLNVLCIKRRQQTSLYIGDILWRLIAYNQFTSAAGQTTIHEVLRLGSNRHLAHIHTSLEHGDIVLIYVLRINRACVTNVVYSTTLVKPHTSNVYPV